MLLSNLEIVNAHAGINMMLSPDAPKIGTKLKYALLKNQRLLRAEAETIEAAVKPSPEFQAYEDDRVAICKAHAPLFNCQ